MYSITHMPATCQGQQEQQRECRTQPSVRDETGSRGNDQAEQGCQGCKEYGKALAEAQTLLVGQKGVVCTISLRDTKRQRQRQRQRKVGQSWQDGRKLCEAGSDLRPLHFATSIFISQHLWQHKAVSIHMLMLLVALLRCPQAVCTLIKSPHGA